MKDYIIGWTCPNCRTANRDSFFHTAGPMCESCEAEFIWDDLIDDQTMESANRYFVIWQKGQNDGQAK